MIIFAQNIFGYCVKIKKLGNISCFFSIYYSFNPGFKISNSYSK